MNENTKTKFEARLTTPNISLVKRENQNKMKEDEERKVEQQTYC